MTYHCSIEAVLGHDRTVTPAFLFLAPFCPSVLKPDLRKGIYSHFFVLKVKAKVKAGVSDWVRFRLFCKFFSW